MTPIDISTLGQFGLIQDQLPYELPPNVFTGVVNARPTLNGMESVFNYSVQTQFEVIANPISLAYFEKNDARYWITASTTTVYAHNGTSGVNLDATFAATVELGWQIFNFNGILVYNNGVNIPQSWDGKTFIANSGTDLVNWPTGYRAKVLRQFRNFLYALDITDDKAERFSTRILWAHPADPGTLPSSWDVADDTKDTGHYDISLTPGPVVEGEPMGPINVLYKTDSVWSMTFIGPPYIFKFELITKDFGALGTNCVASFPGGHVVITKGDVVAHDGSGRWNSIFSEVVTRNLFAQLNEATVGFAFACTQPYFKEIWICIPSNIESSAGVYPCNKAYTWNWETQAIGVRELPNVFAGAVGYVRNTASSVTWSGTGSLTNANNNTPWDVNATDTDASQLLMVGLVANELLWMDAWDSTVDIPQVYLERYGLSITGKRMDGAPKADIKRRMLVSDFRPLFSYEGAQPTVQIALIGQDTPSAAPQIMSLNTFNFTRNSIPLLINTLLFGYDVRISFPAGAYSKIRFQSYSLDVSDGGRAW